MGGKPSAAIAVIEAFKDVLGKKAEAHMKTIADDLIDEGREDTRSRFARTVLRLLESRFSNLTEE